MVTPVRPRLRRRTNDVDGKLAALVDRRRARRDVLLGERFDGRLEGQLFGGEFKDHGHTGHEITKARNASPEILFEIRGFVVSSTFRAKFTPRPQRTPRSQRSPR